MFRGDQGDVPYVPFAFRLDLTAKMHFSYGHCGAENTYSIMRQREYWPQMKKDINAWVKGCLECQRNTRPKS